jgi:membrane fusion protein, multidrug efflux system
MNESVTLALFGFLVCLPLTSCSRLAANTSPASPEAVPVHATLAVSQDVPFEITGVGNVEAIESVEVRSRITGQIKQVVFKEGQEVTKGQLLFTIDQGTLERQAAEQQAQLERDLAMEQQAHAVVARDIASQKQSQSDAEIATQLGKLGVISGQRVNQLITVSDTNRAGMHSDQAAAEAAAGATKADRARLAQTRLQLSLTNVVAPIAGRAGAVMIKTGNIVRENDTTLVNLLQLAPIHVSFGIPEQTLPEVQRLHADRPLTVEASSGNGLAVKGHLDFIDNTVDTSTGTIRLKAVFPNTQTSLWPGQFVHVRLRLRTDEGKTTVPASAIQDGLEGKYTWLVESGRAKMVPVVVVRTYKPENGVEKAILGSGIHPGDLVVTEGQLRLTPGAKVLLMDAPAARPRSSLDKAATTPKS